MKKTINQILDGLFTDNPVLVQLIGMCPTLATSTSLNNAIGMGLAAAFVLICSNVVISLLRKLIPSKVRIACYIVVIAGFVTVLDLLMQAYLPDLSVSLGMYIPLIVVNCIILARAEAFASKNGVFRSMIDGLAMGLGFTFALCLLASIREIIGAGTIYGIPLFGANYQPVTMIVQAPGGFLCLGILIAAFQVVIKKVKGRKN
ncbi:MAG: electron transport complex subunit E [Clostridia bacterium]|nr:electron transport complex subunit E [Clostridia bacterium]